MGRPFTTRLTDRQQQVLDWVRKFTEQHHMPPTVREIGAAFRISSCAVFGFLKALERKGYLKRGALGARSLEFPAASPAKKQAQSQQGSVLRILSNIAAGRPSYAAEDDLGTLVVDPGILNGQPGFVLIAKGESMIEAGILDGDHVIVRQQNHARDGDIVVALIGDDEATVKHLYREGRCIRLQPANKTMKPIYVEPNEVRVQGCVVGVQRSYASTGRSPARV
jgi:repressor LexA